MPLAQVAGMVKDRSRWEHVPYLVYSNGGGIQDFFEVYIALGVKVITTIIVTFRPT